MAVGWLGRARDERHVQPAGAKLHHRFTGRAFGDLDFNIGLGTNAAPLTTVSESSVLEQPP